MDGQSLHHLGWTTPLTCWDQPPTNWCRILSIRSMIHTFCVLLASMSHSRRGKGASQWAGLAGFLLCSHRLVLVKGKSDLPQAPLLESLVAAEIGSQEFHSLWAGSCMFAEAIQQLLARCLDKEYAVVFSETVNTQLHQGWQKP